MATTTYQFGVSSRIFLIADDAIEEVIDRLIKWITYVSCIYLDLMLMVTHRTIRFRFLGCLKIKVKIVDIEMVCLQDPIKPMHIPADILKISKSTVNLRACSKNRYRRTIVL